MDAFSRLPREVVTRHPGAGRTLARVAAVGVPRGEGPHWVDMRWLCQTVADGLAERARKQRVKVDLTLCASPATVIGYADRLYRAVRRLGRNALDVMPNGGTLTLRVDRIPYVLIEVCDTGPGIAPERLAKLWDADDRMREGGGLPATRVTIEAHHGYIWYRPQPSGGSCFQIELPAAGPRTESLAS